MKSPFVRALSLVPLLSALVLVSLPAEDSSVATIIPDKLEDAKGKKIESSALNGKYIGLYFSAGWCPPCRAFTPLLIDFRDQHTEDFEVVFVSFDKSNTEKQRYIRKSEMPWPSIPGAGRRDGKKLSQKFQVEGLPTLIILDPDGELISLTGREDVTSDPGTALEKWKKAKQS